MIGYLKGKLIDVVDDRIMLDVNSVGYEILVTQSWLKKNHASINKTFIFYIHTVVKENELSLIGLSTLEEKKMFNRLLKVPSVGPKTALKVISAYTVNEIEKAVEEQNLNLFIKIKGLAKKTSQKILIELRGQFKALQKEEDEEQKETYADLSNALISIGFTPKEIRRAICDIDQAEPLNQQIKQALKNLQRA